MITSRIRFVAIPLAVFLWTPALALTPEQVYAKAAPAVLHLKSIDAEGSGIFILDGQYVLTNLHVVATGTPVTITVSGADGSEGPSFPNAVLHRVHPSLDLAILKVNTGKFKPQVAAIPSAAGVPKPGAACFAIASPAGIEGALTNTITQGIVSMPRRLVEGQEYIQFSAAVNPGSSGGALLDSEGMFIGLVTAKQGGGEGISFATPIGGMDWKVFVEPAKRTGDRAKYKQAMATATRLHFSGSLAMFGNPGGPLPEELAVAATLSRQALTEFPADSEAFHSLIEIYYLAGKEDVCLALARSAAKVTGEIAFTAIEARSLSILGDVDEACKIYSRVLAANDGKSSPGVAGALAEILAKQKEVPWAKVAYLAKWALVSLDPNNTAGKGQYSKLLADAYSHLPESTAASLAIKSTGFSNAEMQEFPAKPLQAPAGAAELAKAFEPAFYRPLLASSAAPLKGPKPTIPAGGEDPKPQYFSTMPSHIDQFIPAAGGRLGLLVSEEADRVDVFDVALGDAISTTTFPAGTLAKKFVIGGLQHWAVVDKEQFRIVRYPLIGKEDPVLIEPNGKPIAWNAIGAVMSSYRDDVAWILHLQKNGTVSVVIENFASGTVHSPDTSALQSSDLKRWSENPRRGFVTDAPGITLAPAMGSDVFLAIEPSGLVARSLPGRHAPFGLSFPYSDAPADRFLEGRGTLAWKNGKLNNDWQAETYGFVGSPVAMAPVHGGSQVVQLLSTPSGRLIIQILDAATGQQRIPSQETIYKAPPTTSEFHLSNRRRFVVIAHRSSPRIAIFDYQMNQLLSVRLDHWEDLSEPVSKFDIQRKQGQTVRVPFRIPPGAKIEYQTQPFHGFVIDEAKAEILITDPGPQIKGPVMKMDVTVTSEAGLRSIYYWKVHRDSSMPTD